MNKDHEQDDTAMPQDPMQDEAHDAAHRMVLVSALADGQLAAHEVDQALRALADDPQAREAWHAYHLVGDVLRSPEMAAVGGARSGEAFVRRLSMRLASERVEVAHALEPTPVAASVRTGPAALDAPAANDGLFRWPRVAGLASLALAAAVGWWLVGSPAGSSQGGQGPGIASAPAVPPAGSNLVVAGSARGPILRDARLDELLAAHRQGRAGALQGVTGFVQNAGFEATPAPGR